MATWSQFVIETRVGGKVSLNMGVVTSKAKPAHSNLKAREIGPFLYPLELLTSASGGRILYLLIELRGEGG